MLPVPKSMLFGALRGTRAARTTNKLDWYSEWATLCAEVTCTGINGVEITTWVLRRHGDRHGESKGTSTKISNLK